MRNPRLPETRKKNKYTFNHTLDPDTGFIESKSFANAFTGEKKLKFLESYYKNNLRLYRTCKALHVLPSTVNHHLKIDPVFAEKFKKVEEVYTDELEGISRETALDPKNFVERIFQLKALRPEKYLAQEKNTSKNIVINLNPGVLERVEQRVKSIDAEIVRETDSEMKTIDNQRNINLEHSESEPMPAGSEKPKELNINDKECQQ